MYIRQYMQHLVHVIHRHLCGKSSKCNNNNQDILKKILKISNAFDELIAEDPINNRSEVLEKSRKYPNPEPLEKLRDKSKYEEIKALIKDVYPNLENDQKLHYNDELDEKYALFHLCRVCHWLKEGKREMYITFNMWLRINQFILVFAHRIYITVARMLGRDKDGQPLCETWEVKNNDKKVEDKIKEFTSTHMDKVKELQKMHPRLKCMLL